MKRVHRYNGYKQLIHVNATPQWLAGQWERNKRLLAKTDGQEKVSPTAIASSQAHRSGKKYGGNCTPKEFNELETRKKHYCSENGEMRCPKGTLSEVEIRRRAYIAEQCALARSTINNKCFAGGDENHRTEANNYWEAYTKCFKELQRIGK